MLKKEKPKVSRVLDWGCKWRVASLQGQELLINRVRIKKGKGKHSDTGIRSDCDTVIQWPTFLSERGWILSQNSAHVDVILPVSAQLPVVGWGCSDRSGKLSFSHRTDPKLTLYVVSSVCNPFSFRFIKTSGIAGAAPRCFLWSSGIATWTVAWKARRRLRQMAFVYTTLPTRTIKRTRYPR